MPSQVSRNSPKVVRIYNVVHVAPWKSRKLISVYPEIDLDPNGLGQGKGVDLERQDAITSVEKLTPQVLRIYILRLCDALEIKEAHTRRP